MTLPKVLFTLILFQCGVLLAQNQSIFLLEVEIDTSLIDSYTLAECQSQKYPELRASSPKNDKMYLLDNDEISKDFQPPQINFNEKLTYLFVWKNEEIFVALCNSIALKNDEKLKKSPDLRDINFSSTIQPHFDSSVSDHALSKVEGFPIAVTDLKLSDAELMADSTREDDFSQINVNYIFPEEAHDRDIILVSIDEEPQHLKVIKYWIYADLIRASKFKKMWFDAGSFIPYDFLINRASKPDSIKQHQIKRWQEGQILIAESESPNLEELDSKWEMLFKYKVFGEYSCMLPHTIIPTQDILQSELDRRNESVTPGSDKFFQSVSIYLFSHEATKFEHRRSIQCRNIYAINPIEGTVNNLEYLPEVYFLPDYLKIKSINNQSLEEFVGERCK